MVAKLGVCYTAWDAHDKHSLCDFSQRLDLMQSFKSSSSGSSRMAAAVATAVAATAGAPVIGKQL
jgi:hypothetical protein